MSGLGLGLGLVLGSFSALLDPAHFAIHMFDRLQHRNNSHGQKLNLTQQKHAFANQKKCTTTRNKAVNLLTVGLVFIVEQQLARFRLTQRVARSVSSSARSFPYQSTVAETPALRPVLDAGYCYRRRTCRGLSVCLIGADFHGAMVATDPGEKTKNSPYSVAL